MITATEIQRQAKRLLEQSAKFNNTVYNFTTYLMYLQDIIKTEDSNFAQAIKNFEEGYSILHKNIINQFTKAAELMETYANKTIQNEEQITSEVGTLGNEMQDIVSGISSISSSTPGVAKTIKNAFSQDFSNVAEKVQNVGNIQGLGASAQNGQQIYPEIYVDFD